MACWSIDTDVIADIMKMFTEIKFEEIFGRDKLVADVLKDCAINKYSDLPNLKIICGESKSYLEGQTVS